MIDIRWGLSGHSAGSTLSEAEAKEAHVGTLLDFQRALHYYFRTLSQ